MANRRVVVTGLGLTTPLGTGVEKSWRSLLEGKSGIGNITQFDASDFPVRIAGEVPDFNPEQYIEFKEIKKMDRFIHLALAASDMAVEDSGLVINEDNAERVGVVIGSGIGGLPAIEHYHNVLLEKGPRRISPFFIPMLIINLASGHVSMRYGAKGPNSAVATACATGTHAIGDAFKLIQRGAADTVIAGGTEAVITPLAVAGFASMKALSTRNDEPEKASRPFDSKRDGFIMGEGSGIVVLDLLENALERNAGIYAEVIGYGMTGDAYHMTTPSPGGEGQARCITAAINDAGIDPSDVSYINAHGTSTKFNDEYETAAIKKVFADHAYRIPISSTKSMTGHLLGAAGGVEAVISILSIVNDIVPPTINYENRDPACDLDYVPNEARELPVNCVLSNSFGFGGTNACLLFRKYSGD
ncbi:3-oxoacyl-[acyl-carrier-protein] synthase 2 [bacterium BMS3Abin07]|nr:3-oxoacyl-[acyl-carrier-protein] synthase 2 [bacterium BMS3Abin07]GBE32016.1 3-oxoacyl-[acyl-carrier-protein] synthase 2 [bacterium BMS3Bbin05]HDO22032.1 beta-ketoacyl-[acyl-carrier-protein] synthase II [Nitrospirota bacterium]